MGSWMDGQLVQNIVVGLIVAAAAWHVVRQVMPARVRGVQSARAGGCGSCTRCGSGPGASRRSAAGSNA
jgi:hypothetical protein